ncbi:MAG: asparagine synthase [Acidobacteria bacterium]|nr:asparagine synthase [Acidobacteriota bacterium]
MRWSWDGLEIRRYWEIDPGRRLRYARHSDYVDRLGEELSQAVARRTRVCAPAGVLLSGGIDSSSIAVLAARHWNATQPLRAFHARVADENDESRLAREVAAQSGIPFNLCALPVEDVLADLESHVRFVGLPFADLRWKNEVQMDRWLQSQGVQVVLTGDGSDELFNFPCAYVADLIRHGRLLQFIREIGPYSRYHCHTVTEMLRLSLPYLIPLPALRLWKRWKWRTPPAWINPDFARRTDLLTRLRWIRPRLRFDSLSANEDHYGMTRGRRVIAFELRHFLATSCGLELRYPFFDRRLHEFLFAVPWEVKTTNGRFKSLLREVPNLLSSPLRTLTQKANYDPYLDRVSEAQNWNVLRHLFHDPPPRAAEFVSMPAARAVFKAFEERGSRQRQAEVLCLAGFFLWLKSQPSVNLEMARPEGVEFETQAGGKASTAKG